MGLAQRFDGKPWGDRSWLTADVYEADPRFLPKGGFPPGYADDLLTDEVGGARKQTEGA